MPAETHDEMKANPGGQIDPENVIGRNGLIRHIWERLEQQCVVIDSVRRIGKSSVIKKMVAEPPDEWFPIYQDVESIQSADGFARNVHGSVQKFLSGVKRGLNFFQVLLEDAQTDTINFKGRHWTEILENAVRDTLKAEQDRRLILFWMSFLSWSKTFAEQRENRSRRECWIRSGASATNTRSCAWSIPGLLDSTTSWRR